MKKVLSIGKDDFKKLIDGNCYYIDKSQLICDLINDDNQATLITRPRRFGKSLNMSMLKYFFEKSEQDNKYLFDGLEVSKNEKCIQEQGKYPVISISLSSLKSRSFEENLKQFHLIISEEFKRHEYEVFNYLSNADEIELYKQISNVYVKLTDISILTYSLKFLSKILEKAYNQKVVILIDEYDVPLDNAYFNGFYNEMINFIRMLFESILKGNQSLHMAILTGFLRISKESIFIGMNNLVAYSVINKEYSKCYGFTELEIKQILDYYNLQDMLNALLEKNPTIMEQNLNKWLLKTISYYDTKEKESFYHGLLLGLFSNFENYRLVSNRESGDGRFDILLKDYQYNTAIILELKVANSKKELSKECDVALKQIDTKHYDTDLIEEGYTNILKYGIAFFNKLCMVKY